MWVDAPKEEPTSNIDFSLYFLLLKKSIKSAFHFKEVVVFDSYLSGIDNNISLFHLSPTYISEEM